MRSHRPYQRKQEIQNAIEGARIGKGCWTETEKIGDGAQEVSDIVGQLVLAVS